VLPLVQPGSERSKIVDDVFGAFGKITESGKENQGSAAAVASITDSLRELLGIKELIDFVSKALYLLPLEHQDSADMCYHPLRRHRPICPPLILSVRQAVANSPVDR